MPRKSRLPEGEMNFAFEGGDESPHSISEAPVPWNSPIRVGWFS